MVSAQLWTPAPGFASQQGRMMMMMMTSVNNALSFHACWNTDAAASLMILLNRPFPFVILKYVIIKM